MKSKAVMVLVLCALCSLALPASAQAPREDAIWARVTPDAIALDGVLDEAAWGAAESKTMTYGIDSGIPGSGWKLEAGAFIPVDSTFATLKFLVSGNQLYLGAEVNDASVGGSENFNRLDGLLMSIKDHLDPNAPKPPAEYFYAWWFPEDNPDPQPAGQDPAFIGRWAEWPPGSPRTSEQIAAWDAVTIVHGMSNNDTIVDTGYTVEMRFDLTAMGYDVTVPEGDVVEWNLSIYDCDWFWPFDPIPFGTNRVWWQGPWGNDIWYNEVRIHARPDVTVTSGAVPVIEPELVINEIKTAPILDGLLGETVWSDALVHSFDIRYGDMALRDTYPAVGPHRAGQYQPEVHGGQAFILDPADATVKIYTYEDTLYLGFDVNDAVVQYHPDFNRWDGFLVTINDRVERSPDNELVGRRLTFQVAADGTALPQEYLSFLVTEGDARVALALKGGTTVDTLGTTADTGYTAELAVDLTSLGYPPGLGDRSLFIGVNHLDGDSFIPFTDSYGTRTWWFREYEGTCCPVWAYMEPSLVGVEDDVNGSASIAFARSFPNPSLRPQIQYYLPDRSKVTLEVYDLRGRLVERRVLGSFDPGIREISLLAGRDHSSGVYLYRLRLEDPASGKLRTLLNGKALLLR